MGKKLFGVSTLTIVGLYAMLSVIILLACMFMNVSILIGLGVSIAILIIQFLISPFLTDLTMKWFYKIDYKAELPEYLENFINLTCSKHNMKRPKIGLINDGAPNAFTYGRGKNDARLVLTRGIFELLSEDEVKAVVAHEFGHIVHYDMLFMTVAQLVPLVCYFVYQMFIDSDSNNNNNNGALIGGIAFALYIISEYIVLWLSRTREYYADEFSLEETKNPNSLASALVKIGFGLSVPSENEKSSDKKKKQRSAKDVGALGIFDSKTSKSLVVASGNDVNNKSVIKNAMKWEMWNPWAKLYQLHSTHPLISKRLIAISNRSKEFGQEPYINFDYKKPESYIDDFAAELLIAFMPSLIFIVSAILTFVFINDHNEKMALLIGGCGLIITALTSFIKFKRRHKSGYTKTNVANLLSEVKVSDITSIPCELEGNIIGKGDPGCIFSEDFIIQDESGIIFLDYNQPMFIINKVFALFKSHKYIDKKIKVKGWYRRSPVPYVEIYEYEIDGTVKKIYTYIFSIILYILLAAIGFALILVGL